MDVDEEDETSCQEEVVADGTETILSLPRKRRSPVSGMSNDIEESHSILAETAFDAYFVQASKSSRTSDHVFSNLVEPLSAEEYHAAMKSLPEQSFPFGQDARLRSHHSQYFPQFIRELNAGFNILFFGLGSKRDTLNQFAVQACAKYGNCVVVNGFQPNFTVKDMLNSIINIPDVTSLDPQSQTLDSQARRICDYYASASKRPLYLIVHNIDAPNLRTTKARSCLSILCGSPAVRVAASVDLLHAPLLWSSTESLTRKRSSSSVAHRGYAWLWHDLTTLVPHDFELSLADRSSITGASGFMGTGHARLQQDHFANGVAMTEEAAQHILASVTEKARKLFTMMTTIQVKAIDEAVDVSVAGDLQQFAIGYDTLFNAARDNFIATNDTALRSLLGEFKDHGLVLSSTVGGPGGGEVLWIPLRKERLLRVVETLELTA